MQKVDSKIYQEGYYLKAFDGKIENYLESLKKGIEGNRFEEVFRLAGLKKGEKVLDVGCGRGELVYFSLLKGASLAVGIDYSCAALSIADKITEILPSRLRGNVKFLQRDVSRLEIDDKFDCCFLTDIVEHLTDEQFCRLFSQLKSCLSEDGRIIIHTAPNVNWIRFEYPLKRFLVVPSTIIKRLTGKKPYKPVYGENSFKKLISYLDLCYRRDYYNYSLDMHINEQTPASLKKLLKSLGYDFRIWCEDGSSNFISVICRRFWGPDIWAIATPRRLQPVGVDKKRKT